MRRMYMGLFRLSAVLAAMAAAGCAANVDPESPKASDDLGSESQAVITGNWIGPLFNGDVGDTSTAVFINGIVPCEQYVSSDNRWHPGKVWAGRCRSEFGGGVIYANPYWALHFTPGHGITTQANFGFTPSSAVAGSSPGDLPVCVPPDGVSQWTGKVWLGRCLYEFGDTAHSTSSFRFLIQN